MASAPTNTRSQQARKRSATHQPSATHPDTRDVRSKLQDFHRAMEDLVAESEEARDDRTMLQQSLTEAHARAYNATEAAHSEKERFEEQLKAQTLKANEAKERYELQLHTQASDFNHTIRELKTENTELSLKADTSARDRVELGNMRLTVSSINEQLKDYITLESAGVSLLTTTGQVTNFEGIVNQWINSPLFNGETTFQFTCPMTRQPTALLKDQGLIAFMQRIGGALGLDTLPSFYFRYSRYEEVDEFTVPSDVVDWDMYSISDQLTLMAKVVLAYQHRETLPSFTVVLKDNHLITLRCTPGGSVAGHYLFHMTLNIITSSHMRTHSRTPRVMDFLLAEGAQNPFPSCAFMWLNPEAQIQVQP